MRNRALHDRLRSFTQIAGEHLTKLVQSGLEIPFEVSESPGRTSVLYHYRPLSEQFVRERFPELRRLEGFGPVLLELSSVEGLSGYLRALGARSVPTAERDRAEDTLREFLASCWEEVGEFDLEGSHFDRAYAQLESILYENTILSTVVAPVLGVRLAAERLELGSGLALARGDLCEAPPEAVWSFGRGESDPNTLAVLTVEATPREPPPLSVARLTFRALLTALRLFKHGAASLGPSAWWHLDDGPWQTLALGSGGHPRAGEYWLEPSERDELAELLELVRSRPLRGGPLPWALSRFELGCGQLVPLAGLSDHLLAVRALLDGDDAGPAGAPSRLAALCAEPAQRAGLEARVERAFLLERLIMRGELDGRSLGTIGGEPPDVIAGDLEQQLRAVLRDMVCGYLDVDVRRIADELLMAESASKPEPKIEARNAGKGKRKRRQEPVVERWNEVVTAPAARPAADQIPERPAQPASQTAEQPTEETIAVGGFDWHREDGDADWGFDDDPADFSAAV